VDAGLRRHDGVGRGRASSEAVISRRALSADVLLMLQPLVGSVRAVTAVLDVVTA
jgi:hypothetical protein